MENPYRCVNTPEEMEIHLVDLDQNSRNSVRNMKSSKCKNWRNSDQYWYGYVFKAARDKERTKLKKQREDYIKQNGMKGYIL